MSPRILLVGAVPLRKPADGLTKPLEKLAESLLSESGNEVLIPPIPQHLKGEGYRRKASQLHHFLHAHPHTAKRLCELDLTKFRQYTSQFDVAICYHALTAYLFSGTDIPLIVVAQDCLASLYDGRSSLTESTVKRLRLRSSAILLGRIEASAYQRASSVTVVSENDRYELQRRYGVGATVVPNGVDIPKQSEASDRSEVLFLGNLATPKNQDALRTSIFEIMPMIWKIVPNVVLNVVGVGIKNLPADLRGIRNVRYTGEVADLSREFDRSLLTLQPHSVATGIKNSCLDSLAHGVPVLGTRAVLAPIFGSDIPSDFIYSSSEKPHPKRLERLLNPTAQWEQLSRLARGAVSDRFTWANYNNAIQALAESATLPS